MLIAVTAFIRRQGLWLLLLWILREVMSIVRTYRSSRVSLPSDSDTTTSPTVLLEATTVAVLEFLLFGVSIVAFLLWLSVVEKRRELVRLQSRPPGQAAEGEKDTAGASTSFASPGNMSIIARHSRSNSSRRAVSEQASSEPASANNDIYALTDSLKEKVHEHAFVESSRPVGEKRSANSNKATPTETIQTGHTGRALAGNLCRDRTEVALEEHLSTAMNQQSSRHDTMASNDQNSKGNGERGTDNAVGGKGGRNKRKHATADLGRNTQGQNGSQMPSNQTNRSRTRTRPRKSSGNSPKERNQVERDQTLKAKANLVKGNHRKEQVGQSHDRRGGGFVPHRNTHYPMPSTTTIYRPTHQQPRSTTLSSFPPHKISRNLGSSGQSREHSLASSDRQDHAHPQVVSSHRLYGSQTFEQPQYAPRTLMDQFLSGQQPAQRGRSISRDTASSISQVAPPMDQAFTSTAVWARSNPQPTLVSVPHSPLIVGAGPRTLSPISYEPRTELQISMSSNTSSSVASITKAAITPTIQCVELVSEVQGFEYSPTADSADRDVSESGIEVEVPGQLANTEQARSQSTSAQYSVDLELGIKALNRNVTYPQGGESHLCWRAYE